MQEPADPTTPATPHRRKRTLRRKLGFSILAIVMFFGGLVGLDRAAGWLNPPQAESLLFPSGRQITHESCEFSVEVAISAAGIRDGDYEVGEPPQGTYRIAAVGDSFTFGWGVESEAAWPNVLEHRLNEAAERLKHPVTYEVLNFGYPGASPDGYVDSARMALEHFAPNLILVGTLQSDDLIQLQESEPPHVPWHESLLERCFPTTRRLLRGNRDSSEFISYRETFLQSQQYLRSQFTSADKEKYEALPYYVRECFEDGRLNPSLVQRAIRVPEHFRLPLTEGDAWRESARERFEASLMKIAAAAKPSACSVVAAVIPDGPFVSAASAEGMRMLGFEVPEELLTTNIPDEIVEMACDAAAVSCLLQTERFRKSDETLYFQLDGHFNPAGHKLFADGVFEELTELLGGLPRRK